MRWRCFAAGCEACRRALWALGRGDGEGRTSATAGIPSKMHDTTTPLEVTRRADGPARTHQGVATGDPRPVRWGSTSFPSVHAAHAPPVHRVPRAPSVPQDEYICLCERGGQGKPEMVRTSAVRIGRRRRGMEAERRPLFVATDGLGCVLSGLARCKDVGVGVCAIGTIAVSCHRHESLPPTSAGLPTHPLKLSTQRRLAPKSTSIRARCRLLSNAVNLAFGRRGVHAQCASHCR